MGNKYTTAKPTQKKNNCSYSTAPTTTTFKYIPFVVDNKCYEASFNPCNTSQTSSGIYHVKTSCCKFIRKFGVNWTKHVFVIMDNVRIHVHHRMSHQINAPEQLKNNTST